MAVHPWIVPWKAQRQNLDDTPALKRWFEAIAARPATARAYARGAEYQSRPVITDESRKILFGQTAHSVRSRRSA